MRLELNGLIVRGLETMQADYNSLQHQIWRLEEKLSRMQDDLWQSAKDYNRHVDIVNSELGTEFSLIATLKSSPVFNSNIGEPLDIE